MIVWCVKYVLVNLSVTTVHASIGDDGVLTKEANYQIFNLRV